MMLKLRTMKCDYTACFYSIPQYNKNIFPVVQHSKQAYAQGGKKGIESLYFLRKRRRESTARLDRRPVT